jgi:hypothetical protein
MARFMMDRLLLSAALLSGFYFATSAAHGQQSFPVRRLSGGGTNASTSVFINAGFPSSGVTNATNNPGTIMSSAADTQDDAAGSSEISVGMSSSSQLYTAVGAYSLAPQANAESIITAIIIDQSAEGDNFVDSNAFASAIATYILDDEECPDEVGILTSYVAITAVPTTGSTSFTDQGSAFQPHFVEATVGTTTIRADGIGAAWSLTGFIPSATSSPVTINITLPWVPIQDTYSGTEYKECGTTVQIQALSNTTLTNVAPGFEDSEIASSTGHADFEVQTF